MKKRTLSIISYFSGQFFLYDHKKSRLVCYFDHTFEIPNWMQIFIGYRRFI